MVENIKKMIDDDNEVLNVLPQNNVNNRKKYRDQLGKMIDKYQKQKKEVYDYLVSKNSILRKKYEQNYENSLDKLIVGLEDKIAYFNPYHDAYEILGLDKLFYGLRKYYNNDLNIYNSNINKILDIFEQAGIILTKEDFYFSESNEKYLDVIISERKNGNYNSPVIKEAFEELFWENHNMMRYILLNFNHLYYENEKKFNEYVKKVQREILQEYDNNIDNLIHKYQELVIKSNESYLSNRGVFFNMFINKEIATNDFAKEKIEKSISEYFNNNEVKNAKDIFMKLYASINEEKFIFRNKYVLDEVDKLYQEKDSYKNIVATTRKEINTIEKTIYKKHKKLNRKGLFKKTKNNGVLIQEIENSLQELDTKYDELEENRYKEKIGSMVNPTIKDYLLLGKSYLFMEKISKDMEEEADTLIKDIDKNVYSPYNALIDNLTYANIEKLNLIVYDKYRLLGLYLTTDSFLEENLEGLTKTIGNIIIYYVLSELEISLEEINYIMQSDEVIKKASSS